MNYLQEKLEELSSSSDIVHAVYMGELKLFYGLPLLIMGYIPHCELKDPLYPASALHLILLPFSLRSQGSQIYFRMVFVPPVASSIEIKVA